MVFGLGSLNFALGFVLLAWAVPSLGPMRSVPPRRSGGSLALTMLNHQSSADPVCNLNAEDLSGWEGGLAPALAALPPDVRKG